MSEEVDTMRYDTNEYATMYLDTLEPSISGQQGHAALLRAAGALVNGFELDRETAVELLERHFNPRCQPPWSRGEIVHKVTDAGKGQRRRGWLRNWRPTGRRTPAIHQLEARPRPTEQPTKTNKPETRFYIEGGVARWLEHPALLKRVTWSGGPTREYRLAWDGFQWMTTNTHGKPEIAYGWSNGDGSPRHVVDRIELTQQPGETKPRKVAIPYHWDSESGCFLKGEGWIPRVPFMACELREAGLIYIVEGEKCAVALQRVLTAKGLTPDVAATTTGSCSSWRDELAEWFQGKRVLVIPDNDRAGRKYANRVCGDIRSADVDAMIYPAFDGFPAGFDVADWLMKMEVHS